MKALKDALGCVGMVRFIQQYDLGYGDYTKERQKEPEQEKRDAYGQLFSLAFLFTNFRNRLKFATNIKLHFLIRLELRNAAGMSALGV